MLFPRGRTTPRAARNFVVATLTEWGETSRLDDIRVCTSELVTNAVLHGTPAGRMILMRVEALDEQLRIEVHDASEDTPVQRAPKDSAVDGRGLLIVSTTANSWGVKGRVGPGKCVWAAFDRARAH
ncbi:ATP-binding protein [Streptomyces sp. NPDC000963]